MDITRRRLLQAGLLVAAGGKDGLFLSGPTTATMKCGETISLVYELRKGQGRARPTEFSVSGLPGGWAASFSPSSCRGSCSTVLEITVPQDAPEIEFTLIISAQNLMEMAMANTNIVVRACIFDEEEELLSPAWFISPAGNDTTGDGTIGNPWKTIGKFEARPPSAGDTLYCRGGTYTINAVQFIDGASGSAGSYISVLNYPGETPVFDGAGWTASFAQWIYIGGTIHHWKFKGLEIKNMPHAGIAIQESAHDNIVEFCNAHHNVTSSSNGANITITGSGVANNLILNCDGHHASYGVGGTGGDGISITSAPGTGNIIRGCRCWRNNDDGIDLSWSENVLVENCWIWENGYNDSLVKTSGNGMGVKLGLTFPPASGDNTVQNCLLWGNAENGMSNNDTTIPCTIYNCTSYNHHLAGTYNFNFYDTVVHVFRNNISHGGNGISINAAADDTFNSWNGGVTVTNADFITLDFTANTGARQSDGSLPTSDFLHLAVGSDLINAGTNVGLPFNGAAPDLGACET